MPLFFFIVRPFDGGDQDVIQPEPPPTEIPDRPFDPTTPPVLEPSTGPTPDVNSPEERERQAQEALKRQAMSFAGRSGSYSSVDSFASMRQVYSESTERLRDFLETQRQDLISRYPSFGSSYGRTVRSLSADVVSGVPVLSNDTVVLEVQTQVTINATDGQESIIYEMVTVTFVKSGEEWVADDVRVAPLDL